MDASDQGAEGSNGAAGGSEEVLEVVVTEVVDASEFFVQVRGGQQGTGSRQYVR